MSSVNKEFYAIYFDTEAVGFDLRERDGDKFYALIWDDKGIKAEVKAEVKAEEKAEVKVEEGAEVNEETPDQVKNHATYEINDQQSLTVHFGPIPEGIKTIPMEWFDLMMVTDDSYFMSVNTKKILTALYDIKSAIAGLPKLTEPIEFPYSPEQGQVYLAISRHLYPSVLGVKRALDA